MTVKKQQLVIIASLVLITVASAVVLTRSDADTAESSSQPNIQNTTAKPVLTVTATSPQMSMVTTSVSAHGNIVAWQEASIGTEADGLRLTEVKVNVGDQVNKGQVLAVFFPPPPYRLNWT